MDPLSDLLRVAEVRGTLFSRARLGTPFGVSTTGSEEAAIFHVLTRGAATLRTGEEAHALRAGDLVVLPHGDPHELVEGEALVVPLRTLPTVSSERALPCVVGGGPGDATEILCGTFRFGPAGRRWLLPLLPRALVVRRGDGHAAAFLEATLRLLEHEAVGASPGSDLLVARLSDVLLVHVLRAFAERGDAGWLAALADPHLGPLMRRVHQEPGGDWTADRMARAAGLSRTVLFQRFDATMGRTPADWLLDWRMTLAAEALRAGDEPVASLAGRLGYSSEASFSRAFRRVHGLPPATFRRREAA